MPSILVVDDNALNRMILVERLGPRGYEVVEAEDGGKALELLEARRFDLVILDIMMPGIDGYTVLRRIRQTHALTELPVIMATARSDTMDVVDALKLGANDYVTKPLDFAVVSARIETQLALKNATDEIRRLNESLHNAQERIGKLTASASDALRDVGAWSVSVAADLRPVLGARSISIWLAEGNEVWSLDDTAARAPSPDDLAAAARGGLHVRDNDSVVVISGLSGEIYGSIVVSGKSAWADPEMKMITSFARQMGSALELQKLRTDLAAARTRIGIRRQEMLDSGTSVLQVCPKCGRCYDHTPQVCEGDGTALDSPRLLPFRVRGRYRFVRMISSGGMATLFEAFDEKLRRDVALKVIKPEHFNDDAMRARFEQEARAIARIDHPGVIAIYDSGELEEGSLFFVMELLRGMDLGQVLRRFGRGTPQQVAAVVRQVGSALGAAHRAGFIHRDIKPENIFLLGGGEFRVKLLDFGIAKPIDTRSHLTQTGTLIGTPAFMAPEQLSGRDVDVRADIYSLAAVAYEALTGERVAPEKSDGRIYVDEMLAHVPRPLSALLHVATAEAETLLAAALAKNPDDRPRDVDAWSRDLAAALEAIAPETTGWMQPFTQSEATPPSRTTRPVP